jgi:hypothetical protein
VYVRRIDGKETTFGTSGALWRDALVMYDRETGSYWSQVNASAIAGRHAGKTLEEIPSVVTTWGEWKKLHPDTLVLEKPALEESAYAGYNASDRVGATGRSSPDERLPGKDLVVGVRDGASAAAVPLEHLRERGIVNGAVGDTPVVWVAVSGTGAAAFQRRLDGRTLELTLDTQGRLVTAGTQDASTFDAETGAGIAGPLAGRSLRRLPALRVFWYAWTSFHPDTALVR